MTPPPLHAAVVLLLSAALLAGCRTTGGLLKDAPLESVRIAGFPTETIVDAVAREFETRGFTAETGGESELVFDRHWTRGEMFRDGELFPDDGWLGVEMWIRIRVRLRVAEAGTIEVRSDSFVVADRGAVLKEEQPLAHHRVQEHRGLLAEAKRALEAGAAEPRVPR